MELGAGYGRTTYVFKKLLPDVRYVIVDIPPALYVSQRYLSGLFPDMETFGFRKFSKFSDVSDEFNRCRLAFLLPSQMDMLPDGTTDLFLAIDCLHKMKLEQINRYFKIIERLTKQYFYESLKLEYPVLWTGMKSFPAEGRDKCAMYRT